MAIRKFSRQRESIIENLKNRVDHPTADMVYTDIRKIYPNVSLGTVYRNLSVLAEEKIIQKLITDDGVLHFDYNVNPHNHFVCRVCQGMTDLPMIRSEGFIEEAKKQYSGSIEKCEVTFYGICGKCFKLSTH